MLRFQPHGGWSHGRQIIADSLVSTLGRVDRDRLPITSGGQHGLAITALGLLRRGDGVVTDALTYPGLKATAALQGLDLVPVEGNCGAMDPDALDAQCRARKVRAVYLMPTVHTALDSVMDEATRARAIAVASEHDLLIIKDAAYAIWEPDPPPSLLHLAPERTIHLGNFSNSLVTGLRLRYVIAQAGHLGGLLEAIRATPWNAPALISGPVTDWIEGGPLARSEDARRRDGAKR